MKKQHQTVRTNTAEINTKSWFAAVQRGESSFSANDDQEISTARQAAATPMATQHHRAELEADSPGNSVQQNIVADPRCWQ
jgi:hypothetical protein